MIRHSEGAEQEGPVRARLALRDPRPTAALLSLLVVWAPLPFGSVTLLGRTVLFVAIWLLFGLSVWTIQRRPPRALRSTVAALLLLALLGVLQSIPLDAALVERVSAQRLAMARSVTELGVSSGESLALSLAPWSTLSMSLGLVTFAALLYVAATAGRERSMRRLLAGSLLLGALFQTIYGGGRFVGDTNRIWGVMVEGVAGRFRGTFVNPDHFAFYVGLVLPVVFAWGWWAVGRARRVGGLDTLVVALTPPLMCWSALFVGLALSGSRGGMLAALVAVGAQGVLAARASRRLSIGLAGVAVGAVGVASVALLSREQGFARLLDTSSYEVRWSARFEVYRATLDLWQQFPVLGTGLGTFRDAFPWVQPQELAGVWWHAHNDWLEVLATAGVVGALLVLVGFVAVAWRLALVLIGGRRSEDRAAALGALTAAAVHSALDFGMTMPANAFTLAVICGAAATASIPSQASS